MKITRVETCLHLREPSPEPLRDALQALPGAGSVEVRVHTDAGLTGRGDAGFGRIRGGPRAVQAIVDEVQAVCARALEQGFRAVKVKVVLEDGCALVPQGPGFSW